ncbi:uncharacterized protein LOC132631652 isoform X2 [Lycium barbarum]|nr:uncharacterized protein LOC132631652 isoform X2 [Lycium barbarum]
MKPSNKENEVASTVKDTTKYVFVAPGAIGKGRGRGHKFVRSLGDKTNIPFSPSTDQVMQYNQTVETTKGRGLGLKSMCRLQALGNEVGSFHKSTRSDSTMSIDQGIRPMNKNPLILEKWQMQTNIPSFSSTDQVMKYIQANSTSALGKERGLRSKCSIEVSKNEVGSFDENSHYASQNMSRLSNSTRSASTMSTTQGLRTTNKNSLVHEKEHMQTEISISPSTDQVMKSTQTVETSALGKERERGPRSMCSFEVSENEAGSFHQNAHYASQSMSRPFNITRSNSTIVAGQGLRTANKNPYVHDKEHMQTDISVSPSTDQVTQPTQTVETSLCSTEKVKKVRGSNKCKEVASLEVGQKLKVTFYNNRTVGKNSNLFSRHLGK